MEEMMQNSKITGQAWVFGDNINTESIMPTGTDLDPSLAVGHVLEFYNPDFPKKVQPGDFIVAGHNFGMSSSRPAGEVLKMVGVGAVICESSGRIFYRNTWNMGVPVLQCPGITGKVETGDKLEVDIVEAEIKIPAKGEVIKAEPTIPILLERWEAGGMVPWIKQNADRFPTIKRVE
jgi:3-isopropylmalate/(R)-2-methylmalate dehydratase small subunit